MERREFVKSALVTAGMSLGVAFAAEPDGKVWGRPTGRSSRGLRWRSLRYRRRISQHLARNLHQKILTIPMTG